MEDLYIILALGLVAMIAEFIDAIAGGGGLITLPALLLAGIPPVSAIATNKLQAAAATFSATVSFARKGLIGRKVSRLPQHRLQAAWSVHYRSAWFPKIFCWRSCRFC